jgi:nucleotide-binding universal stress UspA family protein
MKKVLIALDYSPTAQKVAETGFLLAKTMGAEVTLLHVIEDTTYFSILEYPPIKNFMGFSDSEASHLFDGGPRRAMELFLEKTKQYLGNGSIQTSLIEGEFAESILNGANDLHADLIVIGSHSRSWLKNIVIGSVTEEVLRRTTIPVFVIPTKKQK